MIVLRGWAALVGTPGHGRVFVAIDSNPPLEAAYGLERRDIVNAFQDEEFARTGFEAACSSVGLEPGPHVLQVSILDDSGNYHAVDRPVPFTIDTSGSDIVRDPAPSDVTWIVVDALAVDDAFAQEPLDAGPESVVGVRGWAIESVPPGCGRAIFGVVGSIVVKGQYGLRRDDVAASLGDERYAESGFDLDFPMEMVPPGQHVLHLRLLGRDGTTVYDGPSIRIDVAAHAVDEVPSAFGTPAAIAHIDQTMIVGENGTFSEVPDALRLTRGDRVYLRGWAIDGANDSLARGVVICIDDTVSVRAVYGLDRPDVASAFERPELAACGFTALVTTDAMPSGAHVLTLRIIGRDGRHFFEGSERVEFSLDEP